MGIKQVKLDVNDLNLGMFVSGLDCPWTQTPFPLQGFYINTSDEIQQLKAHCGHVLIDVAKGPGPAKTNLRPLSERQRDPTIPHAPLKNKTIVETAPLKIQHNVYPVVESLATEMARARELHEQTYITIAHVIEELGAGNQLPILETKRSVSAMVESVLRSPDAFTWLSRVKDKDEYTYSHAIRAAVWGILFGRHIGLPKLELELLALGLLLKDIGKTRLPVTLLENQARNASDQEAYEQFVDFSVEILRDLQEVPPRVISLVKTHCEFLNGSGYPEGLKGDKIPLLGKIASLVTFYDETTTPRGQQHSISPSRAVARLYEVRDDLFQSDLVIEFIRAIGLYPTGTLIQLNSGEVAVVVEQNFERRLKPKIMIVLDSKKNPLDPPYFIDLAADEEATPHKMKTRVAPLHIPGSIEIAQDLDPSAYPLDIDHIRDLYVSQQQISVKRGMWSFWKRNKTLSDLFDGKEKA